ncbi:MAG: GIY-YIG nuclease family protein [Candidatus Paceibacterota bacterium]
MYYIYMARNKTNYLYVGMTDNPHRRLTEHNNGSGSIHTKSGRFSLVFIEEHQTLEKARQREIQIKKWTRDKKEKLITRYKQGLPTRP